MSESPFTSPVTRWHQLRALWAVSPRPHVSSSMDASVRQRYSRPPWTSCAGPRAVWAEGWYHPRTGSSASTRPPAQGTCQLKHDVVGFTNDGNGAIGRTQCGATSMVRRQNLFELPSGIAKKKLNPYDNVTNITQKHTHTHNVQVYLYYIWCKDDLA